LLLILFTWAQLLVSLFRRGEARLSCAGSRLFPERCSLGFPLLTLPQKYGFRRCEFSGFW
jgi:hypothetical protein